MNKKISKAMSFMEFIILNLIWLIWMSKDDKKDTTETYLILIICLSTFIVIIGMIVNIIWLAKGVDEKDIDNGMTDIIMGFVSLQFARYINGDDYYVVGGVGIWLGILIAFLIILGCVNVIVLRNRKANESNEDFTPFKGNNKPKTNEKAERTIWACSCGKLNNGGTHCIDCGKPKPSYAELQTECANCGWWTLIRKDKLTVCPKCGSSLMINSCTNCGWKSNPGEKAPDSCPRCGAHFTNKKD